MNEKCYICGKGDLVKKKAEVKPYGISIGKFDAEICPVCSETFFNERVSDMIDETAKKRGLWGLESRTKIGRVGNSIDVKINKKIAEFAGFKKGEEVRVYPEGKNKIIIESL